MNRETALVICLECNCGIYSKYVFQNTNTGELLMVTKNPHWDDIVIRRGTKGYLTFEEVLAGQPFYNSRLNKEEKYKHDNIFYIDFVIVKEKLDEIRL